MATGGVANASASRHSVSPVGLWSGTVSRPGETDAIRLSFGSNRHVCLVTVEGTSRGTWRRTGGNTFNYRIKEALFDPTGAQSGWVQVDQDAVQDAGTIDSSGTSVIYDLSGNQLGSVVSSVTVTKIGSRPLSC